MKELLSQAADNAGFLLVVVLVAVLLAAAAKVSERFLCGDFKKPAPTVRMAVTAMMGAVACILMFFEFPLVFLAPEFYKLDFSEVPVMICALTMGPVSGILAEFLKIVLKVVLRGTSTAFVGDFANFVIGCSLILPAAVVGCRMRTKKGIVIGCVAGTLIIAAVGSLFNAFYLLPAFSKLYGMPLDVIIGMGAKIFPQFENFTIYHFVFCCVAPLNLIKGVMVSVIAVPVYLQVRKALRGRI